MKDFEKLVTYFADDIVKKWVDYFVYHRPELFRLEANHDHIEAWKQEMLRGRHLPSWIRAISPEAERKATIDAISTDDVFRSQFRSRKDAQRSEIEIIKWGLEHLDRLRKANAEARDASVKRWQMWLVFWVSLVGVVSQFVIAYAKYKSWI